MQSKPLYPWQAAQKALEEAVRKGRIGLADDTCEEIAQAVLQAHAAQVKGVPSAEECKSTAMKGYESLKDADFFKRFTVAVGSVRALMLSAFSAQTSRLEERVKELLIQRTDLESQRAWASQEIAALAAKLEETEKQRDYVTEKLGTANEVLALVQRAVSDLPEHVALGIESALDGVTTGADVIQTLQAPKPASQEAAADPYAELKAAYAAGKVIQYQTADHDWFNFNTPPVWTAWDVNQLRIKSEPQPSECTCADWGMLDHTKDCPAYKAGPDIKPELQPTSHPLVTGAMINKAVWDFDNLPGDREQRMAFVLSHAFSSVDAKDFNAEFYKECFMQAKIDEYHKVADLKAKLEAAEKENGALKSSIDQLQTQLAAEIKFSTDRIEVAVAAQKLRAEKAEAELATKYEEVEALRNHGPKCETCDWTNVGCRKIQGKWMCHGCMDREIASLRASLAQAQQFAGHVKCPATLLQAAQEVVRVIESAGILNLSNGVQLGATSWYAKACSAVGWLKAEIAENIPLPTPEPESELSEQDKAWCRFVEEKRNNEFPHPASGLQEAFAFAWQARAGKEGKES